MSDDLERKLGSWADQASPVTAEEARLRAEAGNLVASGPDDAGGGGTPGSRRLMAAAAAIVLVGAVAIGGWVIANDGDDGPTGVDTLDQPTTTTATDPSTTVAPTTVPETTAVPDFVVSDAPKLIVVHSADHKLEVIDRTTGDTVRVLAEFDDPNAEVPDGEPAMMGRYLGRFVVSPDGQTVFYETCCEPAVGEVFRIPITGGEPEFVTYGTDPAISPDGTKLAVLDPEGMLVVDLTDGSEERVRFDRNADLLDHPDWSPDGTMLVLDGFDVDEADYLQVNVVGFSDGKVRFQFTTVPSDGAPMLPVFDALGNVVVIRQPSGPDETFGLDLTQPARAETYRVDVNVSPNSINAGFSGEPISTTDLSGPVLSQRTAGGGRFVLRTFADGTIRADLGEGNSLEILDHGYLGAAW